uniref:Uncharacterized protein n=1 Tax=Arundo donax TaxID=35708 RepID=A0A0A9BI28_ARUDO
MRATANLLSRIQFN